MNNSVVQFEIQHKIACVRLNRPEVHNAVDEPVMVRLEAILERLDAEKSVCCVILTGGGKDSFCAGGDLKYFSTFRTREQALEMSRRMQKILNRIYRGDKVWIAAINGQALGGGCEIVSVCHFRIAASHATFSFRQAANGLITGWGGGVRLVRLLGRAKALDLLLTSRFIDAGEAFKMGFVNKVVDYADLEKEAGKLAAKISTKSRNAIKAFLRIVDTYEFNSRSEAVVLETELFGDLWVEDDFREWLTNFISKKRNI